MIISFYFTWFLFLYGSIIFKMEPWHRKNTKSFEVNKRDWEWKNYYGCFCCPLARQHSFLGCFQKQKILCVSGKNESHQKCIQIFIISRFFQNNPGNFADVSLSRWKKELRQFTYLWNKEQQWCTSQSTTRLICFWEVCQVFPWIKLDPIYTRKIVQ